MNSTYDLIRSSTTAQYERVKYFQSRRKIEPDFQNLKDQIAYWLNEIHGYLNVLENNHVKEKFNVLIVEFENAFYNQKNSVMLETLQRILDLSSSAKILEVLHPNIQK